MRRRLAGPWIAPAVVATAGSLVLNLAMSSLGYEHDAPLVSLLVVTIVAVGVLALEALEVHSRTTWTAPAPGSRQDPGEDVGTTAFRHLIEVHQISRDADDAVLWQIADLARRRLRQVHGLRWDDDPDRVVELLGPQLADLVSRDRRHRHDENHPRLTVAQLGELVGRIEAL